MDYIYKNSIGDKSIGTISNIEVSPYYQFTIHINNKDIWCHLEHVLSEWNIHFIELEKHVELACPDDVYWNARAIHEIFDDEELSWRIAYAIDCIHKKYERENMSL